MLQIDLCSEDHAGYSVDIELVGKIFSEADL